MAVKNLAKVFFALVFDKAHCAAFVGRDNGFGNNYIWAASLESGLQIATNHKKPLMVIIHKSWCHACKNLKTKFANSPEIQTLSKHFVMVNLLDEEEPPNGIFAPDGAYIPRILFISPKGLVDHEIFNEEGSNQHKYFYSKPEQIAKSMKKVLEKYQLESFDAREEFILNLLVLDLILDTIINKTMVFRSIKNNHPIRLATKACTLEPSSPLLTKWFASDCDPQTPRGKSGWTLNKSADANKCWSFRSYFFNIVIMATILLKLIVYY